MEKKIIDFFKNNKLFVLATSQNNTPHTSICFYAFCKDFKQIYFMSNDDTRHIQEGIKNNEVAGSITEPFVNVALIRGIQFSGILIKPQNEELDYAKSVYFKKHPFAKLSGGEFWMINIESVKMTDNTLGFGKKRKWKRD